MGVVQARTSPAYSTMVFAWSLTEVVRYLFYALSLLNVSAPFLNWLRYSTFIPLYPLGAGSEAYISYLTLPPLANLPVVGSYVAQVQKALGLKSVAFLAGKLGKSWSAFDLARGGLVFVIWPPGASPCARSSSNSASARKVLKRPLTSVFSSSQRSTFSTRT